MKHYYFIKGFYDQAAHSLFLKERRYIKKTNFPYAVNGFKRTGIMPLSAIEDGSLMPSRPLVATGPQKQRGSGTNDDPNDIENDESGNERDLDELNCDPMYGEFLLEQLNTHIDNELTNQLIASQGPSSSTST